MEFDPCEKERKDMADIQAEMLSIEQKYPKVKTGYAVKLEDGKPTPGISSVEGKEFLRYVYLRDEYIVAMQKLIKCKKDNKLRLG